MIQAYDQLFEPGSKVAMQVNSGIYSFFKSFRNKSELPKTLPGRFMIDMRVIENQLNSKFFRVFDRKFQQFIESGLFGFYIREVDTMTGLSKIQQKEVETFKVLTLAELEAGFVVCLTPLAFSFVAFVFEWIAILTSACFIKNVRFRNALFKSRCF